MTRFAITSSIGVPMKMILSLRRREKDVARSPRPLCSTTIGTSDISAFLLALVPPMLPAMLPPVLPQVLQDREEAQPS